MKVTCFSVILALLAFGVACGNTQEYATPVDSERTGYMESVEDGLPDGYVASLPDPAGFVSAMQDMGDGACTFLATGGSRDEFQERFREEASTTANGSSVANDQIDFMSLLVWSSALQNLCPELTE